MANYHSPSPLKQTGVAFIFLILVILPIYSNTFHAAWQFDDKPNIIDNYYLHLKDLQPESLINTFYTQPKNPREIGTKLHRPIACLTFALNWFLGQDNVVGYHAVNLMIHFLTAFLLFLTIFNLFKAPNLKHHFEDNEYYIALLAATIWAVNPIQTQAVTYIVQRMTSLAAMFYVLSMWLYVNWELML